MQWHTKAIKEGREKIFVSSALALSFFIVLTIWIFTTGKTFSWQSIEVLSPLPPYARLWSAITFSTSGHLLFHLGFYKALYQTIPFYPFYQFVKAVIWLCLGLLTYWLFEMLFKLVNALLSFFYNIWQLIVFIVPAIGITLGIGVAIYLALYLMKRSKPPIINV